MGAPAKKAVIEAGDRHWAAPGYSATRTQLSHEKMRYATGECFYGGENMTVPI